MLVRGFTLNLVFNLTGVEDGETAEVVNYHPDSRALAVEHWSLIFGVWRTLACLKPIARSFVKKEAVLDDGISILEE